jgi:hypothetical protein
MQRKNPSEMHCSASNHAFDKEEMSADKVTPYTLKGIPQIVHPYFSTLSLFSPSTFFFKIVEVEVDVELQLQLQLQASTSTCSCSFIFFLESM